MESKCIEYAAGYVACLFFLYKCPYPNAEKQDSTNQPNSWINHVSSKNLLVLLSTLVNSSHVLEPMVKNLHGIH